MTTRREIVGILSIVVGILLIFCALLLTGGYILGTIGSLEFAFWGIGFLLYSVPMLIGGVILVVVGSKSYRGSTLAYKLSLVFLSLFAIITVAGIVLFYFSEKLTNAEHTQRMSAQQQSQNHIQDGQKIEHLAIVNNDNSGFSVDITTTGGLAGDYNLEMEIGTFETSYYKNIQPLTLGPASSKITKRIDYTKIFSLCSNSPYNQSAYICVPNTGTSNTGLTLTYRLKIGKDEVSLASTNFAIDTHNRQGQVEVSNFKMLR